MLVLIHHDLDRGTSVALCLIECIGEFSNQSFLLLYIFGKLEGRVKKGSVRFAALKHLNIRQIRKFEENFVNSAVTYRFKV